MTRQIDSGEFKNEVLGGKGVVLVDFFATWCGPCKMMAPALEELSEAGYRIFSVDVDEEQLLAAQYGIMNIPTLMIFKDGEKKEQIVGLTPKSTIREKLDYYAN
ncbi:MAG: thioredoxin [Peptoniphilaceae bacterium]|nr:thioredoxin [Peptoniphilaceae bacterium]MDD7434077.1 thioredoxin [Peptoniphilaceae bacterium]MDY3075826.1 thioredoxin [Peptoniphilaceae bacterium]MDY3987662.1 thioredoxin [Peptoniphilaceae bacterium]MDY6146479.1 thioredoxin [Peptoniphilaceae bacterium]